MSGKNFALGLGAGLSQLGAMMEDRRKEKLAQQLEIDREKRMADNQKSLAEFQQNLELKKPAKNTQVLNSDGTGVNTTFDSLDRVLASRDMTQGEIEDKQDADAKEKAALSLVQNQSLDAGSQAQMRAKQAAGYDASQARADRLTDAQIRNYQGLYDYHENGGGRAGGSTNALPVPVLTDKLLKDTQMQDYIRAAKKKKNLPDDRIATLANLAVTSAMAAAQRGQTGPATQARERFRQLLVSEGQLQEGDVPSNTVPVLPQVDDGN